MALSSDELRVQLTGPLLSRLRQAAALLLWERGAVKVSADEPFLLASGNHSPIYVDCRCIISDADFLRFFAAAAALLLDRRSVEFDVVAGGETAGIPYGNTLAMALGKPFIYVRKKAKAYGTTSRVEGDLQPGSRVLLVEDLITDGGSKVGFLEAISEVGSTVGDVLVLFDRQQGGGELLGEHGVDLHSVTDRTSAFVVGSSSQLMDDTDRLSCEEYFRDPVAWHQKRGLPFHDG